MTLDGIEEGKLSRRSRRRFVANRITSSIAGLVVIAALISFIAPALTRGRPDPSLTVIGGTDGRWDRVNHRLFTASFPGEVFRRVQTIDDVQITALSSRDSDETSFAVVVIDVPPATSTDVRKASKHGVERSGARVTSMRTRSVQGFKAVEYVAHRRGGRYEHGVNIFTPLRVYQLQTVSMRTDDARHARFVRSFKVAANS